MWIHLAGYVVVTGTIILSLGGRARQQDVNTEAIGSLVAHHDNTEKDVAAIRASLANIQSDVAWIKERINRISIADTDPRDDAPPK